MVFKRDGRGEGQVICRNLQKFSCTSNISLQRLLSFASPSSRKGQTGSRLNLFKFELRSKVQNMQTPFYLAMVNLMMIMMQPVYFTLDLLAPLYFFCLPPEQQKHLWAKFKILPPAKCLCLILRRIYIQGGKF